MVTTVEDNDTVIEPQVRQLRVADRCDVRSCGAQAFVIAVKMYKDGKGEDRYGELLFCGHHYKRGVGPAGILHRDVLDAQGWHVVDCLDMLNEKPSVSANA